MSDDIEAPAPKKKRRKHTRGKYVNYNDNSRRHLKPWQPGQVANPAGRPVGSRNKLSEQFILAMHEDFNKHGAQVIETVRQEDPSCYLSIIAKLVPRDLHISTNAGNELIAALLALNAADPAVYESPAPEPVEPETFRH
jgi:hypothetical protein